MPSYHVGNEISKTEVVKIFRYISWNANKDDYYVGITCNPERREDEHNATFLAVINCPGVEEANQLEQILSGDDFDAGALVGNAHNEDSTKVYIYRKNVETIE